MNSQPNTLLFDPIGRRWYHGAGEEIRSLVETDGLVLASFLRTRVLPRGARPTPRGNAELVSVDAREAVLRLVDRTGDPEGVTIKVEPTAVSLASVEWVNGLFDDHWIATDAALRVSMVRRIGLRFFLPALAGVEDKTIFVSVDNDDITEIVVGRGVVSEHWIEVPADRSAGVITFSSSFSEPTPKNIDVRDLGAVLVGLNLNETEWQGA